MAPSDDRASVMRAPNLIATGTPDAVSGGAADLTLTLILMAARRAGGAPCERDAPRALPAGAHLAGKTLGLIGFGRVGQEVARRAHYGFGMRVVVFDCAPMAPEALAAAGAEALGSVDDVVREADFVSLHCSGDAANRHLIDARRLDLMKPSAFLINTARGELVDQRALLHALWFETIAGAALDVTDVERPVMPEILACDAAVHLSGSDTETRNPLR
jgi:glyoxylate reductase